MVFSIDDGDPLHHLPHHLVIILRKSLAVLGNEFSEFFHTGFLVSFPKRICFRGGDGVRQGLLFVRQFFQLVG